MRALRLARHEKERGVGAHLVVVRQHVGLPLVKGLDAPATLRVLQQQPVAVDVKPVVVGATPWPDFVVLAVLRIAGQVQVLVHVGPGGKALKTVGIVARIEQNDRLVEQALHLRALPGRQVVGDQRRSIAAAGLIAVDAEALVEHRRHRRQVELRRSTGVGQLHVPPPDRLQVGMIGLRRDGQVDQRTLLVSAPVLGQHDAGRSLGQRPQIGVLPVVTQMPVSDLVAEKLLRRGNGSVVGNVGQIVGDRFGLGKNGRLQQENDSYGNDDLLHAI